MILVSLLAALALQTPPVPLSEAEINYDYRCKSCHEPGQPGVPDRTVLRQMKSAAIVRSLETGKMKAMGTTLTADEKKALAAFIVGAGSKP